MRLTARLGSVTAYVTAVDALGAATLLVCLPSIVADPPLPWVVALALALGLLSDLPLLDRRVGHNREAFTFAEACLLVGVAFVPGPVLVAAMAVAVLALNTASRVDPVKAAFNALSTATGVALAVLTASVVAGGTPDGSSLPDLLGLVLGTVAFHTWNGVVVNGAMARAQSVPFLGMWREGLGTRSVIGAGNAAVGLCIVLIAHWNVTALLLLPPVAVVLYLLYRGYLRASQERDTWQQLEVATRELNHLEEPQIAAAALRRAHQLFRTDRVELLVDTRLYGYSGGPVACTEVPAGAGSRSATFVTVDGDGSAPVLTCLVAPLEGPQGQVGALRLLFDGPVRFSSRERQVLSTFAHAVATTVVNAALYQEVRDEAARQAHAAQHDHLTGLGNRALLGVHKRAAVAAGDGTTALLLLDLDHFKEINDTLGHATGDVLLQAIGHRLAVLGGPGRLVCRLGGDEFAVLLTGLSSPDEAGVVADEVLRLLTEPVDFDGLRLSVEASLGVACAPQDAATAGELFRRADVAMYQAKSSRASWLRYDADRDDSSVHRQALVAELRSALDEGQVVVHYQPHVDLRTGAIVGAEALCRWEHPTRGLLLPGEFITTVEQSGLVRPFTRAVLEQAVAEAMLWPRERGMVLAVNVSARSLLDTQLPQDVAEVLQRYGLPASQLVLEITETTAASELEVVEDVLSRLSRLGVGISVDDFGTGYSSLAFLQRTAVHELKVDRSFVARMLESDNDRALVRATVQLARSLGARSVAEGVEEAAQVGALLELGCDVAQGWYFSRPVPGPVLRELLQQPAAPGWSAVRAPAPRSGGEVLPLGRVLHL